MRFFKTGYLRIFCVEKIEIIGGELDSTGRVKPGLRVVVGQWATLKAD